MSHETALAHPIPEAAARLGVGRSTVYREIEAGRLESITIGRRRLVTTRALEEYLERITDAQKAS